jgi:hypothetical protein
MSHIRKIVELQENSDFKIAPCLSPKHVDPKQFEKMKVNVAAQLLSHSTASATRFAVHEKLLPADALTTAWFVDVVNSWFDAANARSRREALYSKSGAKIKSLLLMMEIIPKLTFSSSSRQSSWKPIQTGILVSTQSCIRSFCFFSSVRFVQLLINVAFNAGRFGKPFLSVPRSRQLASNSSPFSALSSFN